MSHPGGTLGAMSTQRPGRHCPAPSPGSWVGGPLLGFDTETTGVDPRADRLVTAAIVARGAAGPDGRRQEEILTWLADPGVEIPEAAAGVHGITTERARAQGRPVEQVLEDVADRLASAMSDHVPVVAFNGSYDLTLIESELARHGLATLERRLGRPVDEHLPARSGQHTQDDAHGGGLAGAVAADEAGHHPGVDVEGDVLEDVLVTEEPVHVAYADHGGRLGGPPAWPPPAAG